MNVYLHVLCLQRCSVFSRDGALHCAHGPEPDLGGNPGKSLQTTRETGFLFNLGNMLRLVLLYGLGPRFNFSGVKFSSILY